MEQTVEITWFPVSLRKHPDTDREVLITIQYTQENVIYDCGIHRKEIRVSRYVYMGYYDLKNETWEFADDHAMFGKVIAWAEKPTVYTGDTFGI